MRGFFFESSFYALLNEGMFKDGILQQGTTFLIGYDGRKTFWDVTDNGFERTSFLSEIAKEKIWKTSFAQTFVPEKIFEAT